MLIFVDDDAAYRHWVTHHRSAYVVTGRWRPRWSRLELHRAACPQVRDPLARRAGLTTGGRFKAGATAAAPLLDWFAVAAVPLPTCSACQPLDATLTGAADPHLTHLDREILDYILEASAIHLEDDSPRYAVTLGDIATSLRHRPAHIGQSVQRLIDNGLLEIPGAPPTGRRLTARRLVLPTALALRRLEGWDQAPAEQLARELDKLRRP